jgi:ribosomal protein S19
MSRSKWKGPHIIESENLKAKNIKKNLNIISLPRNVEITPKFIGLTINIYNGKDFQEITITDDMIGHKLGEFVFTRKNFSFKKKKK